MTFRFARHTQNLQQLHDFYTSILGFEQLGHFKDHDGYNGLFIGPPGAGWHLEFTQSGEAADHHFDDDDLLVFYPGTQADYEAILFRIRQQRITLLEARNPYWRENGTTIADPDGYRVIISPLRIRSL